MNSNNDSQEQFIEKIEADSLVSLEDFIKELEAKEKDLQITSELFVEIEEYEEPENVNQTGIANLESLYESHNFQENSNRAGVEHAPQSAKELTDLRQTVRSLEKERKEMREIMSRRQTDYENYRKRIERDRHETFRNLVGDLATQMLPVVDNLGRALDSSDALADGKSPEFQHFLDGIFLVNQQLIEVLAEMGIEPIHAVGEAFDPNFHEAAAADETGEFPPNTVTKELLRGYRMGEKVIRHAVVKVSSAASGNRPIQPAFQEIDLNSFETE